ncbi:hypothetical protein [Streptomyces qinglanensis]|uniref:hypothetical protein n=1 Tax=Streptomyces qinglanensis TaxID=943816 RepID=UPI003D728A5E
MKELFGAVDERLLPEGAWMEPQQHYLTYRRLKKFASVRVLPRKEVVTVNLNSIRRGWSWRKASPGT